MKQEEMTLKEFIEVATQSPTMTKFGTMGGLFERLINLEAIENWLNVMYGVEFDIKVRPAKRKEGRFYRVGVAEELFNSPNQ